MTHLRVFLGHLKEHEFKHCFSDTLNLIYIFVALISKHRVTAFSTAQDLLLKHKTLCLRLKASSSILLEKLTLVLHQYVFMVYFN